MNWSKDTEHLQIFKNQDIAICDSVQRKNLKNQEWKYKDKRYSGALELATPPDPIL